MNSRERILCSISHKQPDKVPVDLGATPSSGISVIAYNNLLKNLGKYNGDAKIYDVVQQVVQVDPEIIDLFKVDVIDIGRSFRQNEEFWHQTVVADGSKAMYPSWFTPQIDEKGNYTVTKDGIMIAKMPVGATFFDQTIFPYEDGFPTDFSQLKKEMDKVLWSALVHSPWDSASDADFYKQLRENSINLKKNTDKALMIVCGCNMFEWGTFLRRMDNFLMDIYLDSDQVEYLLDALLEIHMQTLEKVCQAVGDVVDIVRFGDDLGMDTGMFMSEDKYRELFKPRHKKLCDYVHSNSNMKTFLHSCGSIYPIIPDLIDAGYDILNPVQTTARGMDPKTLKNEFGKDITFWGAGCNTRSILNQSTPEEVYDYTSKMLEIFMRDGGYVFNQEHNIMPDVPPENILAMYKAVNQYNI